MSTNTKPASEFACKCGCGFEAPEPRLVAAVSQLRGLVPDLVINCGCRCASHNRDVGGEPNSQHLLGRAADVSSSKLALDDLVLAALKVSDFEQGGIGYYPSKHFIHCDVRRGRARWKG